MVVGMGTVVVGELGLGVVAGPVAVERFSGLAISFPEPPPIALQTLFFWNHAG